MIISDYGREGLQANLHGWLANAATDKSNTAMKYVDGVLLSTLAEYLNNAGLDPQEYLHERSTLFLLVFVFAGSVKDMRIAFKQEVDDKVFEFIAAMLAFTVSAIVEGDEAGKAVADEILAEANAKIEEEAA